MAGKSRRRLLERCASEGALLFPIHFGAPHVAAITSAGASRQSSSKVKHESWAEILFETELVRAATAVCSLPPCGGGLGGGSPLLRDMRPPMLPPPPTLPHKGEGSTPCLWQLFFIQLNGISSSRDRRVDADFVPLSMRTRWLLYDQRWRLCSRDFSHSPPATAGGGDLPLPSDPHHDVVGGRRSARSRRRARCPTSCRSA